MGNTDYQSILRGSATTAQTATSQHSLRCTLHLRALSNKTVHCALSTSGPIPHWQPNGNLRVQPWPDAPAICHGITWKTLSDLSSDNQQVIQQLPWGIYPRGSQWGRQPVGRPPTPWSTCSATWVRQGPLEQQRNLYLLFSTTTTTLGHQKYSSRKGHI